MTALSTRYPLVAQLEAAARPHRPQMETATTALHGYCGVCDHAVTDSWGGLCDRHWVLAARSRLHVRRERRAIRRNLLAWWVVVRQTPRLVLSMIGGALVWALLLAPIAVRWLSGEGR